MTTSLSNAIQPQFRTIDGLSTRRTSWDRRRHPGGYTCHFVRDS